MLFKNQKKIIENGKTDEIKNIRKDILDILNFSMKSVDPYNSVKLLFKRKKIIVGSNIFNLSDYKNIYLIGFGKASIGMAKAVIDSIEINSGAVITSNSNQKIKNSKVITLLGNHPIPDDKNIEGTKRIIDIIKKCEKNDLLIVLISGGGSSLLCKPRVNLKDIQKTTDLLLKSGANIKEINTIRKHLSFIKGGQLVKINRGTIISLIMSDIIGDPIEFIASGPTFPDSTTYSDAKKILKKYDLNSSIPNSIKKVIENGIKGKITETPKRGDSVFKNVYNFVISNNKVACQAAMQQAEKLGYKTMLLTTSLDGEAKDIGKYLISKVLNFSTNNKFVFISGGETTVTVKGDGKGGRNQEMVLSVVKDLFDNKVIFSSFASDGIDGKSDAAGAIADSFTYKRALEKKLDTDKYLNENNSYEFFKILDDIFLTGPTGLNFMDIQIIVKY